ncbi:MAG: hypothetical protein IMZ55_16495, partial [Acidobacteria bacterium]|nr:hypothetical protein [Acidobacteriota bacterium]
MQRDASVPRNPHKEQSESDPDERRQDLPWRVVDAIEPDDDVLSRLAAEDDAGRAVAPDRRAAPGRAPAGQRPAPPERRGASAG